MGRFLDDYYWVVSMEILHSKDQPILPRALEASFTENLN